MDDLSRPDKKKRNIVVRVVSRLNNTKECVDLENPRFYSLISNYFLKFEYSTSSLDNFKYNRILGIFIIICL